MADLPSSDAPTAADAGPAAAGPAPAGVIDETPTLHLTEAGFHDEFREIGSGAIYVWEVPVRVTHWLIVLSLIVLAVTGLYMHSPFFPAPTVEDGASTMATVRFIHDLFAIVFTCSFAVRFYWGFVGNSFASWRAIIPHNREQFHWGREMAKYYLFLRREPVPVTGHNFLAGAMYTIVSIGMAGQILTGLLLFGWVLGIAPVTTLFGWGSLVPGGIQSVRMLHYFLTFLFVAFAIHHVYSGVIVDVVERNGTMSSIFSGYKNIKPGRTLELLGVAGKGAPEEVRRMNGEGS